MSQPVKLGELILGRYQTIAILEQTNCYQWLETIDHPTQKSYRVQILLSKLSSERFKKVFDYFDTLKNINHKTLITPEQIRSNQNFSMVNIYESSGYKKLELSQSMELEQLRQYLYEAAENLHVLHNKGLTHGRINPNSFMVKEDKVYLTGFGYAPLLMPDNSDALKDCGAFTAPELLNRLNIVTPGIQELVTPLIDIYCFAKTVAFWLPSISESSWYVTATSDNPSERYTRMRKTFTELDNLLTDTYGQKESKVGAIELELTQATTPLQTESTGGLIPKYTVELTLEPAEAGRVEGSGNYSEGKEVEVKAIAFPDWEFIGWEGDVRATDKNFSLIVSKNIKLTACFRKEAKSLVSINVEILPLEARESVKVNGSGNYTLGTTVHIHAWSLNPDKWRFTRWEGEKNSYTNPLILSVTQDLEIVAKFEKLNISVASNREKNIEPGSAFGGEKEVTVNQSKASSPKQSRKLVGSAFKVDEEQELELENIIEEPEQETALGTAFIAPETEEAQTEDTHSIPFEKKPIIGSAFND